MTLNKLPRYFSVAGLPVKLVETSDGGLDVLAWDFQANDLVRHLEYLDAVVGPSADVDVLSEAEFEALLEETRRP
jgi:hypothetical protein